MRIRFCMLALLLLVGAASAHTSTPSPDGQYLITVGSQNEPTTTYMKSGLDLILRVNDTDRTPILLDGPGLGALTATLIAPNGDTLSMDLRAQHGKPGYYQFVEPYFYTQTGVYYLTLEGTLMGPDGDSDLTGLGQMVVGNINGISDQYEHLFPEVDADDPAELTARISALESRVSQLENGPNGNGVNVPAPGNTLVLVGLLALAFLVGRRTKQL